MRVDVLSTTASRCEKNLALRCSQPLALILDASRLSTARTAKRSYRLHFSFVIGEAHSKAAVISISEILSVLTGAESSDVVEVADGRCELESPLHFAEGVSRRRTEVVKNLANAQHHDC